MRKALAVLVGLRKVNPAKYKGWDGTNGCWGCELDVENVERILQSIGFQITVLKSEKATRRNVMTALATATQLKKNDIFVFYYSGHGGQQPDQTGPKKDELDGKDETLVLYDGELRDDSLNDVWLKLKPGVRVVMLSDSCNSGTNYKALRVDLAKPTPIAPLDAQAALKMKAQLIHMGGCRDSNTSAGYASGGLFTMALCNVWKGGAFKGDYKALYDAIYKVVTSEQPDQQPAYNEYGPVTPEFRQQQPFAVKPGDVRKGEPGQRGLGMGGRMRSDPIATARQFVKLVELPKPPRVRRGEAKDLGFNFDAAKDQAAVVGSDVISFVKGVTAEQRNDVVNASLLAQLVAKKKLAEPKTLAEVKTWYESYFDALSRIGFLIQDKGFAEYKETSENFEAHQAIIEVATALLAGSPGALLLVKTTLQALQRMSADSPWITLFNRESQSANTARFQVSLVDQDETARFLVSLIAFGLEAKSTLTQVLFFKFRTNEVTLNHHSGKVTIDAPVLASVRDQIATKLAAYANDYVKGLDV